MAKPKPKKPSEEQKKTEKTKVDLKRKIPQEFQDFGESKTKISIIYKNTTRYIDIVMRHLLMVYTCFKARKSVRQSTSEHTRKTNLRLQERQDAPRRRRGAHRDKPLTQEELLSEAKITAEINIRSLGTSLRLITNILHRFIIQLKILMSVFVLLVCREL